jgi:hypothetical protein
VSTDGQRSPAAGAALALGAAAAAIAALPDVRRVAAGGLSPGLAWLALTGSTALVLGPLLAAARALRTEAAKVRALLLGAALATLPVAVLGQSLKLHTHHRPLGAATFAFLALGVVLGCILVTVRVLAWTNRAATWRRRGVAGLLAAVDGLSLCIPLLRAISAEGYNHGVLDACRVFLLAALAFRALDSERVRALARRAGVLAWVLLVLAGLLAGRGAVRAAVRERAPVLGGPAAWL